MAGYSQRQCSAGVLIWNVPNPQNGQAAQDATVTVTLTNVPLTRFNVEAYIIDDRRQPTVRPPTPSSEQKHGTINVSIY